MADQEPRDSDTDTDTGTDTGQRPSLELPSLRSALRRGRPRRPARTRVAPRLPGSLVAVLVGGVAGLALVGLTSAGLHACTALRGTSSCGKPGILLLLAATALTVSLGSLLLRIAGVETHASTSLLGVGLLVVVVLLALLPVIYDRWMLVVVPTVAMLTFAAAWWLTTTYVEPGERVR